MNIVVQIVVNDQYFDGAIVAAKSFENFSDFEMDFRFIYSDVFSRLSDSNIERLITVFPDAIIETIDERAYTEARLVYPELRPAFLLFEAFDVSNSDYVICIDADMMTVAPIVLSEILPRDGVYSGVCIEKRVINTGFVVIQSGRRSRRIRQLAIGALRRGFASRLADQDLLNQIAAADPDITIDCVPPEYNARLDQINFAPAEKDKIIHWSGSFPPKVPPIKRVVKSLVNRALGHQRFVTYNRPVAKPWQEWPVDLPSTIAYEMWEEQRNLIYEEYGF